MEMILITTADEDEKSRKVYISGRQMPKRL